MEMEEEMNSDTAEEAEDDQLADGDGPHADNEEEMQFDITVAATHSVCIFASYFNTETAENKNAVFFEDKTTVPRAKHQYIIKFSDHCIKILLTAMPQYMGDSLSVVGGRSVLEAGWRGRVPALPHHSTVFPGETVPMLLTDAHDAALLARAIATDKLFGLLYPDESGARLCGYGAVCEVFEAQVSERGVQFKARAVQRVRASGAGGVEARVRLCDVRVLADVSPAPPLRRALLDAATTPWPRFVYHMFDYRRLRAVIQRHFDSLALGHMLPEDPVSLSFWVASNLTASPRDRLALFMVDGALLRLHMECDLITKKSSESWLCCVSCGAEIARRSHAFAMSSDGVHANYTNLGGYVHDVVTVSRARGVSLVGAASAEYSWFPGYVWRVCVCAACSAHLGWRFTAASPGLRPPAFYSLCRNYVTPADDARAPPL